VIDPTVVKVRSPVIVAPVIFGLSSFSLHQHHASAFFLSRVRGGPGSGIDFWAKAWSPPGCARRERTEAAARLSIRLVHARSARSDEPSTGSRAVRFNQLVPRPASVFGVDELEKHSLLGGRSTRPRLRASPRHPLRAVRSLRIPLATRRKRGVPVRRRTALLTARSPARAPVAGPSDGRNGHYGWNIRQPLPGLRRNGGDTPARRPRACFMSADKPRRITTSCCASPFLFWPGRRRGPAAPPAIPSILADVVATAAKLLGLHGIFPRPRGAHRGRPPGRGGRR